MLVTLNLPSPKLELLTYVEKKLNDFVFTERKLSWCQQVYGKNNLYADYEYYTDETIVTLIKNQFQKHFSFSINNVFLILMNSHDRQPRVMPPHTDKLRMTAINFYTRLGGNSTNFILYDKYGLNDINNSDLLRYDQLRVQSKHNLKEETWYGFNSKQFHSIENVTSKRLCIGLFFAEPFDQFLEVHNNLLIL